MINEALRPGTATALHVSGAHVRQKTRCGNRPPSKSPTLERPLLFQVGPESEEPPHSPTNLMPLRNDTSQVAWTSTGLLVLELLVLWACGDASHHSHSSDGVPAVNLKPSVKSAKPGHSHAFTPSPHPIPVPPPPFRTPKGPSPARFFPSTPRRLSSLGLVKSRLLMASASLASSANSRSPGASWNWSLGPRRTEGNEEPSPAAQRVEMIHFGDLLVSFLFGCDWNTYSTSSIMFDVYVFLRNIHCHILTYSSGQ